MISIHKTTHYHASAGFLARVSRLQFPARMFWSLLLSIFFSRILMAQPPAVRGTTGHSREGYCKMPAIGWQNALVSGNGFLGCLVYGDPLHDTIVFNDKRLYLPSPAHRYAPQLSASLTEQVKDDCLAGNYKTATMRVLDTLHKNGMHNGGDVSRHPAYLMTISLPANGGITNYRRTCNFETGEIIIRWTDQLGNWERKTFVSRKDNVIVQYLTAPGKGKLSCSIRLVGDLPGAPKDMKFITGLHGNFLEMKALYPKRAGDGGYEGAARIITTGGKRTMRGDTLFIDGATSLMLLTKIDRYRSDAKSHFTEAAIQKQLDLFPAGYNSLLERHLVIHKAIYNRVAIDLGADRQERSLSNEELLEKQRYSSSPVAALWERVFDAGRYYYLSASSDVTPPDLFGMWTGSWDAAWGGMYHLDANVNLSISGGNTGDMPEAMEGYFSFIERLAPDFETNARTFLNCRGLLSSGNTPGDSGIFPDLFTRDYYWPYQYVTGEMAWLLQPFWEHYQITGDLSFLKKRLYPMLKKMGHFYEDFLDRRDSAGHLIFVPSVSPENQPANSHASLTINSTFDIASAKFILNALIKASDVLGVEGGKGEGIGKWNRILKDLPEYFVNKDSALQEWSWPGLDDNYNHRHSSHLCTVWPYGEITPEATPALFRQAHKALQMKECYDYSNTGHGTMHSALIAAGLKDKEIVSKKIKTIFQKEFLYNSLFSSHNAYRNIFCADVINSIPTLFMEMLVSSTPGQLELLPAMPDELKNGAVTGIKCRNRITVERLAWDEVAHTIDCTLRSDIDQEILLIERSGIRNIKANTTVSEAPLGNIARRITLKAGASQQFLIDLEH